jgi:1,2-diacylglycerol 3-alpha-glucosyltransferase
MDRPGLRIGFFSDTYRPYISGAVRSMEVSAQELRVRGNSVVIVAPSYAGYTEREPEVVRLPSLPLPGGTQLRLTLPFMESLTGQMADLDFDVVHFHSPFTVGFLGLAVAAQLEVPAVFSCHSLYEEYVRAYMPWAPVSLRKVVRRYTVDFCNLCDAVVAPSVFVRDFLVRAGVSVPVRAIPTGIGPSGGVAAVVATRDAMRKSWAPEAGPGAKFLLYVGRLSREKNIGFILDALDDLRSGGGDFYLLLVGDGPDRGRLAARAARLGLTGRAVFAGALPPVRVREFYAAADVFTFASLHETQGLVILEAMAGGLPVVAVESPASAELMGGGDSGILVPPAPAAMAAAVRRVTEQPELAGLLATKGRARAAAFSAAAMAARLEDLYRELVSADNDQHAARDRSIFRLFFSPRGESRRPPG